ncbi:SWIRM-domain-containing protein [Ascodesmis nigricans]|uniref:SWIRM-domain-containing protein n=1 Tax=Ascodesmis nigricans TaxID=341454 RepID=A0A4S2N6J5_9PEZI|nr:SWIRM-domain-containing protein [Ascodesmis nigricans]
MQNNDESNAAAAATSTPHATSNDQSSTANPATTSSNPTDASEAEKQKLEEAARGYLVEQTHAVVIPSYAQWFDMGTISQIEMRQLPEFFNNRNRSKTPLVYKDYRDFMINTYRLNPSEYLTVTACRRNLAGDVCSIMRVHAFLEQWGLINYQIDPETRPSNIGPPYTGHFRITADTPRGLQPFQPPTGSIATPGKPNPVTERVMSATPIKVDSNLEIRKNVYDAAGNKVSSGSTTSPKAEGDKKESTATEGASAGGDDASATNKETKKVYHCFSCSLDCTRVRYHFARSARNQKQIELCPNCYLEGRFPTSSTNTDYVRIEHERIDDPSYTTVDHDATWTDQETLLLLEGLELHNDDWNLIADHVGTKTREQCVIRFLQLPIEDNYLEEKPEQLGPLQYSRLPFTQADNPVMSVVAFLASIVDPKVAAAAAKSSIEELTKNLSLQVSGKEKSPESSTTDKPAETQAPSTTTTTPPVKSDPESSAMEIDPPASTTSADQEPATNTITKAASIALGTAAARSHALASHEEREMTKLVNAVVNCNLRKLELKLNHFNELEAVLQAERREIEKARQQLFLERLAMKRQVEMVREGLKKAVEVGGQEGMNMVQGLMGAGMAGGQLALSSQQGQVDMGVRPVSLENPQGYVAFEA